MLGLAPSCSEEPLLYRQGRISIPSTFPISSGHPGCPRMWGDRPDSHRLGHGPHPCASTTSASITVRLEGLAPPTHRLSSEHSSIELQTGNAARSLRGLEPLGLRPYQVTITRSARRASEAVARRHRERSAGPRTTENPRATARRAGEGTNEDHFMHGSTRQESHLRPRGPGPRALLLSYAERWVTGSRSNQRPPVTKTEATGLESNQRLPA
jgi:hypothetical protein